MTDQAPIYLVVAVDSELGIGKDNKMPWHLSKEIKYFKELTTKVEQADGKNAVIMGRKTWESIPKKFRPLPDRLNIVLTRNADYQAEGAEVSTDLDNSIEIARKDSNIENIYVIGGGKIFSEFVKHPQTTGLYVTELKQKFDCDVKFPEIPSVYNKIEQLGKDSEGDIDFEYLLYEKE